MHLESLIGSDMTVAGLTLISSRAIIIASWLHLAHYKGEALHVQLVHANVGSMSVDSRGDGLGGGGGGGGVDWQQAVSCSSNYVHSTIVSVSPYH